MKLIKLFIIFITVLSCKISAQMSNGSSEQKKNIVAFPTSANAYAIDKVGKLPIDLFRGKANINIPFYTINVDGINIPIALSYNTGGIKLNEVASTVGLGWSLSIPNTISQNIMDKDDKYSSLYTKDINVVNVKIRSVGMYDDDIRQIIEDHYEGVYDTRPDLFNYSLPLGSGNFIFNNSTGYTIPHEDLLITATNNKKNIKIVGTDGTSYFLSTKNRTIVDSGIPGSTTASSETMYQIDSIRTVTNKKVLFEYGKGYSYTEKSTTEKVNVNITNANEIDPSAEMPLSLPDYERYSGTVLNTEKLITKIIFPDGVVYFNYSNDGLPFSDGTSLRKDIWANDGVALRQILIKDKYEKVIKNYHLNFSYFVSNSGSSNFQDYRLKLLNVYDDLKSAYHKFYYDESQSFPARNSSNDDYWGYINSTMYGETTSNIPDKIYTDYTSKNITIPSQYTRDRNTNPMYTQIGVLNRIDYPTGGSKYLYYENANKFFTRTDYQWGYIDNFKNVLSEPAGGLSDAFGNVNQSVTIPPGFFIGKENPKIRLVFGNTCENNVDDETSQIHETSCYGNATANGMHYGTNGKPGIFEINDLSSPINISLSRTGKCTCGYGIDVIYGQYNKVNTNLPIGGLRIKKVEDKNENNFVNTYNYKYEVLDPSTNTYKSSGVLNMPFEYTSLLKRYITQSTDGKELYPPSIQKYLVINNSSTNYNGYNSSDVVTYKQVTEYNDLGQTVNVFSRTNNSDSDKMYTHIYSNYDEWKNGLLEKNIILNKAGDTVRVQTNKYVFNSLKNPKSGFTIYEPDQIAFALNLDIDKFPKLVTTSITYPGQQPIYTSFYPVNKEIISINSGKIENVESKTVEYFPNHTIETVSKNLYSDTDINKPINLQSTENIMPDGEKLKTTYSYATEKGNQLMIDRNMIGIPLETMATRTIGNVTKTLGKSETIYPTVLPTAQTGNLILPLSSISYDISDNTSSTDVKFNKYDDKGNLQQYTTRDGISTTVIWGYNKTQPIAKIEGAKLSDISQSTIDAIVNASNTDASAAPNNDETALFTAFKTFRDNLPNYQITTYTYDPLIGVRSITPPSGIRENYLYDSSGRLEKVIDMDGKILKEMKYNYKN